MRSSWWKQKYFTFFDGYIYCFSVFLDAYYNITFQLIKEFFPFIKMIIFPGIGSTNNHYNELSILPYGFVSYRRFKQITVIINPFLKVKGPLDFHMLTIWYKFIRLCSKIIR